MIAGLLLLLAGSASAMTQGVGGSLPISLSTGTAGAFSVQVTSAGVRDAGANKGFLGVQEGHRTGRALKTYATVGDTGITGAVATTLVTMTPYEGLVAGTPATTFAVTANKKLALQQMCVTWRNNTAVVGAVTIRFRMLAGTVLVGSPIHLSLNASTLSAVAGSGATECAQFPDGFELSGAMQFGVTQQAQSAVAGFSVELQGYEY